MGGVDKSSMQMRVEVGGRPPNATFGAGASCQYLQGKSLTVRPHVRSERVGGGAETQATGSRPDWLPNFWIVALFCLVAFVRA